MPGKNDSKRTGARQEAARGRRQAAGRGQDNGGKSAVRDPRELVVHGLLRLEDGGYSNIVWDHLVRQSRLGDLDKVLATRIYYGTIANLRRIDAIWAQYEPDMAKRADKIVRMTLRSALYQMLCLDRVPTYSIVSSSVDVVKRLRSRTASGYCNALLRKMAAHRDSDKGIVLEPGGDAQLDFALRYSLNDDIARLLNEEFGAQAEMIAECTLSTPPMNVRVNLSKTSMAALLAREGMLLTPSAWLPESSAAAQRNLSLETAMDEGLVQIQDEAAQLVVLAMGEPETWGEPGRQVHVWDACAGQGGKSLHLLDRMACAGDGRSYRLLSTDLYANKLERLGTSQRRHFSAQSHLTKVRDLLLPGSVPMAPFDAILLDAPCTGLGVLRRHPEAKLLRHAADIAVLAELQKGMLDSVSKHLRVGGLLLYAVCTITRAECEDQVSAFLERHENYALSGLGLACLGERGLAPTLKLLPGQDKCDGFFMARFVRMH
ncbi:MAG: hypothetical protein FWC40_08385 [Proteobacteria bacterium]|nr:hypothetical protein [Pseudomonadota bacterium]